MGAPAIDNLLWDWNGTLLDDVDLCVTVVNTMLAERGRPSLTRDGYRLHFDFPVVEYYRQIGFSTDPEGFAELSESFIRDFNAGIERCRIHAEAAATVRRWHQRGGRQAVLSASRQDHLERFVRAFALDGYFEALGGIGDIYAAGKLERGRELLGQLAWAPSRTLLIGDTRHDFEVAQGLGLHCLLVASGHQSEERLRATGAEVVATLAPEELARTSFAAVGAV